MSAPTRTRKQHGQHHKKMPWTWCAGCRRWIADVFWDMGCDRELPR
jgi:hypothetical protein